LYNFYRLALNASVIGKFAYIMEYSMYKTFANKYKKSIGFIKISSPKTENLSYPTTQKAGKNTVYFIIPVFAEKNSR